MLLILSPHKLEKKCQNLGFELDPTASKHVATKVPVKKQNQLNASKQSKTNAPNHEIGADSFGF